jgi:hypothetical protein
VDAVIFPRLGTVPTITTHVLWYAGTHRPCRKLPTVYCLQYIFRSYLRGPLSVQANNGLHTIQVCRGWCEEYKHNIPIGLLLVFVDVVLVDTRIEEGLYSPVPSFIGEDMTKEAVCVDVGAPRLPSTHVGAQYVNVPIISWVDSENVIVDVALNAWVDTRFCDLLMGTVAKCVGVKYLEDT